MDEQRPKRLMLIRNKPKCMSCQHRIKGFVAHSTLGDPYCIPCIKRIQATKDRMEDIARKGEK